MIYKSNVTLTYSTEEPLSAEDLETVESGIDTAVRECLQGEAVSADIELELKNYNITLARKK